MAAVKVWTGSAWVDRTAGVKRWNGSAWVADTFKHWNGSAWVENTPPSTGITYVGGAALGANQTNINLAWPGVATNDVAYIFWSYNPATTVPTDPPTGFTTIGNSDGNGGTSPRTRVFRKVCTGSETGNVTVSLDSAARHAAVLAVYRGVNPTTPEDVAVAVDNTHVVSPTHNPPPITGSTDGFAVLCSIHERVSSGDTGWTPPSGFTERGDTGSGGTGSGGSITAVADDLTEHAPGTVTPGNWTGDNATGFSQIVTYTIALRPA
jgi:hypothetical protein